MTIGDDRDCIAWSSNPDTLDWARILPWPLTMRCKAEELVQTSTTWPESGLFLLNPRFYYQMQSPLQKAGILFLGGWGVQLPYNWNPPSGTTFPVCQSSGTAPDLHATLKRHVNHATPSLSSAFNISGQNSSCSFATMKVSTHHCNLNHRDGFQNTIDNVQWNISFWD